MAKNKKPKKSGEQLELIEVAPENAGPIIELAREYKKYLKIRQDALKEEVKLKEKIRSLVKEAGLQRLKDGVIRFKYDGVTVSVTPQDELVQVKEEKKKQ